MSKVKMIKRTGGIIIILECLSSVISFSVKDSSYLKGYTSWQLLLFGNLIIIGVVALLVLLFWLFD